jgi:hypothetical protein
VVECDYSYDTDNGDDACDDGCDDYDDYCNCDDDDDDDDADDYIFLPCRYCLASRYATFERFFRSSS